MRFVVRQGDRLAEAAIQAIVANRDWLHCDTKVLGEGEAANRSDVVLFTHEPNGQHERFPGRWLRSSVSVRRPDWALQAFAAAALKNATDPNSPPPGFTNAVLNYVSLKTGGKPPVTPAQEANRAERFQRQGERRREHAHIY